MGNLNTKEYDIELLIIEINKKFDKMNTNFLRINNNIDTIYNKLANLNKESSTHLEDCKENNNLDFTWDYYEIQKFKTY